MRIEFAQFDFEVTNRCNADCHFCPRDLTPHQGLMEPDVFDQALARAIEFRDIAVEKLEAKVNVALCGLGEPLLNKHLPDYVAKVREAGFDCSVSSNGALLDEKKAAALLDAGMTRIDLNVGERGEAYEEVYKLKWEKTFENVKRFLEMAEGRCDAFMILVNHRHDTDHLKGMVEFWREHGATKFQPYQIINRGGAIYTDGDTFGTDHVKPALADIQRRTSNAPICVAPLVSHFVGYDGQHYLCCQDWTKKTPMGTVFDRSFLDVMDSKLTCVASREPICSTCNVDPINHVIQARKELEAGSIQEETYSGRVDDVAGLVDAAIDVLERLGKEAPTSVSISTQVGSDGRNRLPIVASDT